MKWDTIQASDCHHLVLARVALGYWDGMEIVITNISVNVTNVIPPPPRGFSWVLGDGTARRIDDRRRRIRRRLFVLEQAQGCGKGTPDGKGCGGRTGGKPPGSGGMGPGRGATQARPATPATSGRPATPAVPAQPVKKPETLEEILAALKDN